MSLHGGQILGGRRERGDADGFRAADPRSGVELEPAFADATADEVAAACEMAAAASREYAAAEPERRARFLREIASGIEGLGEALIERAESETGLPGGRLLGERGRTVAQLRMFADLVDEGSWVDARVDRADPDRKPLPKPDVRRMLVPLGPVAVFGASNFPLAFSVAGGDTASALAAGCPVVVKAHPAHPGVSEMVGEAIARAVAATQLPEGLFSMVHGAETRVGRELVRHPAVRAVAFTGSLAGGRALFDLAATRPSPIPVFAEMGSANPVFVLPGALTERGAAIAEQLAGSVVLGTGQFCTNPGMTVMLDGDPAAGFREELATRIGACEANAMVHAGIARAYEAALAEVTAVPGVSVVARGGEGSGPASGRPALLATDATTCISRRRLREEVYGPVTVTVTCADRNEMLSVAESLEGHLTATVIGSAEDLAEWAELLEVLREKVGRLVCNGVPTGVEVCAAMHHGGPYPATTDARSTSVGTAAILRFARPLCFQDFPQAALPPELQDDNPRRIWRTVDGELTRG